MTPERSISLPQVLPISIRLPARRVVCADEFDYLSRVWMVHRVDLFALPNESRNRAPTQDESRNRCTPGPRVRWPGVQRMHH